MRLLSLGLIVCLLLLAQAASAETYSWGVQPNSNATSLFHSFQPDGRFSSPMEAFEFAASKSPGRVLDNFRPCTTSGEGNCFVVRSRHPSQGFGYEATAIRRGDACPNPGDTINPATGQCETDCSLTTGKPEMHVFQVTSRASVDDPFPDPSTYQVTVPPAICSSSCRYTNQSTDPLTCGSLNGSDGLGLFCIHSFTGTGDQCQAGDTPGKNSGDFGGPTPVPPTDPDDPTDPANTCQSVPGYVWTGTTCAKLFEEDPDTGGGDDGGNDGGGNDGGGDTGGGDTGGGDTGGGDDGGDTGGGTGGGTGCGGGSCPDESTEYDGSAEWSDGEATALGSATGDTVSEALTGAVDEALEGREQEIEDALGELPDKVEGWFSDLPGLSFMDNLFVPAAGCSELVIPIELGQYNFSMPIDFCVLSGFKTLLEWVIWCLTAIAVWNVYYSGLRLQNASASRGGF